VTGLPAAGPAAADPAGRRVRRRFVVTTVVLVTLAAVLLSSLAYALVARSLRTEVLDRAVEDARFNVEVLAAERLPATVEPGDIEASGLAADLQRRDVAVFVDLGPDVDDDYVSGVGVPNAPALVSDAVRELVEAGNVAAQRLDVDGTATLVVAARRPPTGPDFYFLTDVSETENALRQLQLVLLATSLLLVVLGAAAGWRGGQLAGSLASTVAQLRAARVRERRFVADVSHELRTPITALVHEASELTDRLDVLPPETHRVVELLDADVRRLRDLVEELLELSRLDAADVADPAGGDHLHADLEVWDLDVARFLEAVVARRAPDATVHAPEGLRVRTDRRRVERIVGNLVDNAVQHAPGAALLVTAHHDGSRLHVEVADDGPGVPDGELERIFDRFTKADASRGAGGSGLGLAIAKEHARILGAELTAHPHDGGGLLVRLSVPAPVVTEP
jgi:signal transduction histidine kinase